MFGLGTKELIIIAVILLIILGPKLLPKIAKSFAESARQTLDVFKGKGSKKD
jgi:Sec-independent protein translocase protein TatA